MSTEQMRSEFEKWANKLPSISISGFLEWQGDSYVDDYHQCLWQAWQSSRAALVVELPRPHAYLIWIQAGYAPDDYWDDVEVSRSEKDKCCDGSDRYRVYSEFELKEMFSAAGITVKDA